jgi:hypothetical protein
MLRHAFISIVFVTMIFVSTAAKSQTYVDLQSGSLMGLVHASVGYRFAEKHDLSLGLGYVPDLSYHEEMFLYSARYQFQGSTHFMLPGDIRWQPFRFGLSLLVAEHPDLYKQLPEQYPDGYYTPTAVRVIFNYQSTFDINAKTQLYWDISMLDVELASYIREPEFFIDNYEFFGLTGVTNFGFGVRHMF